MIDPNALNADPTYLVGAIERNLLMTGSLQNRITPNGVIRARFAAHDGHCHAVDQNDAEVPIFNLFDDGAYDLDSSQACLCSYVPRQTHSVRVNAHASFMFTTTMNG